MEMVLVAPDQLKILIQDAVAQELRKRMDAKPAQPTIKGIHGLARALGCSVAKAQQLKNSGAIPYFQNGKLVLFDPEKVLQAIEGVNIHRRGRRPRHIEPETATEIRRAANEG